MQNQSVLRSTGNDNDEPIIELLPLVKALFRRIGLIIVITLLFGAAAFIFTHMFVTPTYRTDFTAYVNNHQATDKYSYVTSSDLSAAKSLAKTYAEIIRSRHVLTEAGEKTKLDYSYEELKKMVSVKTSDNSEIIMIYVASPSPEEACALAESIASVSQKRISAIIESSSMQIVDEPYVPDMIFEPNYLKNTVIGAFIGFVFIIFVLSVKILTDNRIKSDEELESRYGIPVIGIIPDYESASKASAYGYGYGRKGGK